MRLRALLCVVSFAALFFSRNANAQSTTPEVLEPRPTTSDHVVEAKKKDAPSSEPRRYTRSLATCDAIAVAPTAALALFIGGALFVDIGAAVADGGKQPPLINLQKPVQALPLVAAGTGVGYLTCGPVMHFGEGRFAAGLASLAVRAGLPFIAGVTTYGVDRALTPRDGHDHMFAGWQAALVGTILIPSAIVGALVIDYAVLSNPSSPSSGPELSAKVPLPTLALTPSGGSIGLAGRF